MTGQLKDRAVIAISGPQTKDFLQGLITNDIGRLAPDRPLYAALLTPQGKLLFDFLLHEQEETVFVDCAAASAHTLLKRLTMYRLRAKVELTLRDDLAVFWNEDGARSDPRLPELGARNVGAASGSTATPQYLSNRLTLGIPEGQDFGSEKMFALDAGLEELHGVSFDKGCYIGQELTARMKHRGTARKRLLPVSTLDGSDLPSPAAEVRAGNIALGEITSVYGPQGFALIRLDRCEEAGKADVHAGETGIRLDRPAWLSRAEPT